LARRLVARVAIDNADAIVEALGFIWVKTDDGRVVKLDETTNRVVAQRRLDTATDPRHYCQGLGTDGRSVWACAASDTTTDVVRVDPRSLRPVLRVAVHKPFEQEHFPFVGGRLWVLGGDDGSRIAGIDPATGAAHYYELGARCTQAAGSGVRLFVTCRTDDVVLRIDATGRVVVRRSIPAPGYVTVAGSQVWIDTRDGIRRTDDQLRTIVLFRGLVLGLDGDLAADATGAVWARQQQGFLFRIDAWRNRVSEQVVVPGSPSGGSLLCTPTAIWTTAADDATLFRLRA
jgi:hypothetical protein